MLGFFSRKPARLHQLLGLEVARDLSQGSRKLETLLEMRLDCHIKEGSIPVERWLATQNERSNIA